MGRIILAVLALLLALRMWTYNTHQNKVDLFVDGKLVYSGCSWGFMYKPLNENGKMIVVEIQGPGFFDFSNKAEYVSENVVMVNKEEK